MLMKWSRTHLGQEFPTVVLGQGVCADVLITRYEADSMVERCGYACPSS